MRPIEKYVEAMENKDFAGLAELFTPDGILCDYCTTSASQQEYHIYGKKPLTCSSVINSASAVTPF